ncbi:MAG: hypothetical protein PVJ36_08865 [Nitrospirota bacterium]|jgi:hypothetical protein
MSKRRTRGSRIRLGLPALLALLLLNFLAPARAETPYVHSIGREEGSLEEVSINIEKAAQANIMAPGYEKFGILGRRVTVEGEAVNRTDSELRGLVLTFTARDVFGKALDECRVLLSLPPGGRRPFRCSVEAKDASELNRVTYRVGK